MNMKKVGLLAFLLITICSGYTQVTKVITTEIQGVVPTVFTLSTDMTDIETLDLVNSTSTYLGKVIVYTNTKGLWTIIISSINEGKLVGMTPGNNDVYPYSFEFGTLSSIDLAQSFKITYSSLVPKATIEYPVNIRYKKLSELTEPVQSDTYSDIVTITVTIS